MTPQEFADLLEFLSSLKKQGFLLYNRIVPKSFSRTIQAGFAGPIALAIVVLLARYSVSAAEEFLIDTWRFDDDLPRDGINSIAQGADGYLWLSSRYGLARFDGVRFANFSADMSGLFTGNHYANLIADRSGTVWIGTPGGGVLRWQGERLVRCLPSNNPVFGPFHAGLTNAQGKDLALSPDGRVMGWSNGVAELVVNASLWGEPVEPSVCQDRQGNIWFVTYQHRLVRVEANRAREMTYGEGEARRNWIALQTDDTGELWAGTQRDLGIWHGDRFEPIAPPTELFPVEDLIAIRNQHWDFSRQANAGVQANASRLWVVALGRAWLLGGNRWITNVVFEPTAGLYETSPHLADRDGNLWFRTTRTSLIRASVDGTATLLTANEGLPAGRVDSLHEDREGSLWAGLEHTGLIRLRPRHFIPIGAREGTKAPLVWAVVEDSSGAIWLGTENGGLHRWQEGRFTQFKLGNGSLPGSVYSLCFDRQGTLWAGTGDSGVFRFENGRFVQVWEYPGPAWNKRVYVIHQDHLGQMWFGCGVGLFGWKEGKLRGYIGRGFDMGVVRAIAEDAGGRLWVGMSAGAETRLACLEGEDLVARGAEAGLIGHDIFGLHPDADGSMWIGTAGGGLWRWQEGVYSHYTTQEGLPDDRIFSIEDDRAGNLWLGSPAGILRLTRSSVAGLGAKPANKLECLVFDRTDGLPTRECSGGAQPSIHRARDGRLLFAMTEGAVALAPERILVNRVPPPVLIEEVRVDGKPQGIQPQQVLYEQTSGTSAALRPRQPAILRVGPGRHAVEFRYTAPSLLAASKVRLKRRLEGVDSQWSEADTSRSALYNLTAPGNYRFLVKACNNDGVWNENAAAISLTVLPYLWQTLGFRIGAFVGILAIVGGSIRFFERRKLRRRLAQLEMQQLVQQERARIARDIHDELGANLTEIGLLSEFAQRDSALPGQIQADVQRIALKAGSSTRALDEIVWAVNPRNDTLEGFATYACAYAEEQLRLAEVRCRLEVASPLPRRLLRADMRHDLFMAFKEAINNVLKHARASQVQIRISAEPDRVTVSISDNGCGFVCNSDKARASTRNGLANMKDRLESGGGGFACESSPGSGTRVTLTMRIAELEVEKG